MLEKLASRRDEDALAKLCEELGLTEVVPILEGEDAETEKPSATKCARETKRGKKKKQSGIKLIESSDNSCSSKKSDKNTSQNKRTITK